MPSPKQPGFRISEITLFTTIGDDDEEGVVGFLTAEGTWMPMVAADMTRLAQLRDKAAWIAKTTGKTVMERAFVPEPGDRVMRRTYEP